MADKPAAERSVGDTPRMSAMDGGNPPFQGAAHGAGAGGSIIIQDVRREHRNGKAA